MITPHPRQLCRPTDCLTPQLHAAPARSLIHMWRYGMRQACTNIIQRIALDCKRPDAAAALMLEFTSSRLCATDVAADLLAHVVRTDRTPAAVEVLQNLLANSHFFAAGRICVEMARCATGHGLRPCMARVACWACFGALLWTGGYIFDCHLPKTPPALFRSQGGILAVLFHPLHQLTPAPTMSAVTSGGAGGTRAGRQQLL